MALSALIVALIGSLQAITSGSSALLVESGDSIGAPPPLPAEAVSQPLSAPGGWVRATPPPDPAPIFTDRRLATTDGALCIAAPGSGLVLLPCTDTATLVVTMQPRGRGGMELVSNGQCLTSETGTLLLGLCGTPGSDWTLTSSTTNPLSLAQTQPLGVTPRHLCLTAPAGSAAGAAVVLGACNSSLEVNAT